MHGPLRACVRVGAPSCACTRIRAHTIGSRLRTHAFRAQVSMRINACLCVYVYVYVFVYLYVIVYVYVYVYVFGILVR